MDYQKLREEVYLYNSEYKTAIKKLMEIDDINDVLSPVTALIMQYIENYLKAIIQDCFEIKLSADDLHIVSHSCRELLNVVKEKYEKYSEIDFVNNQFARIEECINYLEGIFGENTLINARYPIDRKTLTINRQLHTIVSDEYKMMYTVLRYAIEHLLGFYEIEKIYQKIVATKNQEKELQRFIDYCNKEFDEPKNVMKIHMIKEIDKRNRKIIHE